MDWNAMEYVDYACCVRYLKISKQVSNVTTIVATNVPINVVTNVTANVVTFS